MREAIACTDPVEREFFNTGGVKGRTEFEYICSLCGADPDPDKGGSPLVADAVLGLSDSGNKFLPLCVSCHSEGNRKEWRTFGKADQPAAKASRATAKRKVRRVRSWMNV